MSRLYFFGDSWTSEKCEVEKLIDRNQYQPEMEVKSIPAMIGESLGVTYENFSLPGSSQMYMLDRLIKTDISTNDHAFFFLTAPSRRFYLDSDANKVNTFVDDNKAAVNDFQDAWLSSLVCYALFKFCQECGARAWFVNLFNVAWFREADNALWNAIPDECWILPRDRCVVSELFDPEFFINYQEYKNSDFYDWLKNENQQVHKYVRPCFEHPNLTGRKKIADYVIAKLKCYQTK